MGKTVFNHGKLISPEFLNAINAPRYAANPQNDGELPYPDLAGMADVLSAIIGVANSASDALDLLGSRVTTENSVLSDRLELVELTPWIIPNNQIFTNGNQNLSVVAPASNVSIHPLPGLRGFVFVASLKFLSAPSGDAFFYLNETLPDSPSWYSRFKSIFDTGGGSNRLGEFRGSAPLNPSIANFSVHVGSNAWVPNGVVAFQADCDWADLAPSNGPHVVTASMVAVYVGL